MGCVSGGVIALIFFFKSFLGESLTGLRFLAGEGLSALEEALRFPLLPLIEEVAMEVVGVV